MRISSYFSLGICSLTLSVAHVAHAESDPIGAGGRLILSADRLFGVSHSTLRVEDGGNSNVSKQSRTDVALLWRPQEFSPYLIPQVGIDVGVTAGLTLGGGIGFYTQSGSNEDTPSGGNSTSRDSPSFTAFYFAPRVGYGIPLLPWLAFWPRLGITYYNLHSSQTSAGNNPTTTKSTVSGVGLNLDPMFVFLPAKHFGISAGPYLDLPLGGSASVERTQGGTTMSPPDNSTKYTSLGLKIGLLGAFL